MLFQNLIKKTFWRLHITFFILLVSSFSFSQSEFKIPAPENLPDSNKLVLWATQYYIHSFNSGGKIPFKDVNGVSLKVFGDTCNFCEAALEGTAFITDSSGRVMVLNFEKTGDTSVVNCRKCKKYSKSELNTESWGKSRWSVSSGFGRGVLNYRLIPFRTIAVDKACIDYGCVVYIPLAKDVIIELTDGEKIKHDGYFFAGDTGGAIDKNHIDIFTGIFQKNPFPAFVKSTGFATFDAYIIRDINIINGLKNLHTK